MSAEETSPEEQVRALLAEARAQQPMPAEVLTRLDNLVADLAREAQAEAAHAPEPLAPVVALNPWRRRVSVGLVAAAAVVLAVVAVPRLLDSGADSATSAGEASPESAADAAPSEADSSLADSEPGTAQDVPPSLAPKQLQPADPFDFALLNRKDLRARAIDLRATKGALHPASAAPCGIPPVKAKVALVNYNDATAALVYLPAVAGKQRVELWTCPGPTFAATLQLPAR